MGFLDSLSKYVVDITNQIYDLQSGLNNEVNSVQMQNGYTTTSAKRNMKPFIIGFIPPDISINYKPIEVINSKTSIPSQSTASKQSVSAGVNSKRTSVRSSPRELQPKRVNFNMKDLGSSLVKNLKERGYDANTIQRVVPFMVGQINTECGSGGGKLSCLNYNIGNVQASAGGEYNTPGDPDSGVKEGTLKVPRGGKYILSWNAVGSTEKGKVLNQKYPAYFQASDTLDEAAGKWVDTLVSGWPGVMNAQNIPEYTAALRPDLNGGKGGPYFTASEALYSRRITAGVNTFVSSGGVDVISEQNGINYYSIQGSVQSSAGDSINVDVMTNGNVTDLESDDPLSFTGRNIRIADKNRLELTQKQVKWMNDQINIINNIPPLALLVNPQDFNKSYEHSVDSPKARRGHINHIWLEKPLSISCKGVTAAQYAVNSVGDGGITNLFRVQSISYANLMSLVQIYKNNGYIYSGDMFGDLNDHLPLIGISLYIYYDNHMYIGSFDTFDITDEASTPYNLGYSFKFNARYDIDV